MIASAPIRRLADINPYPNLLAGLDQLARRERKAQARARKAQARAKKEGGAA